MTARQSDLRGPLAIVVGSEGQGLGPAVRRRADLFMRIPMKGAVGSLNAAVAGSILLFEAVGQRGLGERAVRPRTQLAPVEVPSDDAEQGDADDPPETTPDEAPAGAPDEAPEAETDAGDDLLPGGPPIDEFEAPEPA